VHAVARGRAGLARPLLFAGLMAAGVAARPGGAADTPGWVKWDPGSKSVKMEVVAGNPPSANGGWNFNGFFSGNGTVTVPLGSTVEIAFKNNDQLQHSLVVIAGEGDLPPEGGDPAFPRAFTVKKVEGIPPGGSDRVRFVADKAGRYRWFCGVAGHGVAGMWNWFVVSAEAKAPSVESKAAAAPGGVIHAAEARSPHPALAPDGHAWAAMSEGERLRYLEGFLAAQAVRQAAEAKVPVERLRREGTLAYPFAPSVYKTRLEDYFFYRDRRDLPLHEALAAVNEQLATARGAPSPR
jgi:plastocyanin